MTLSGEIVDGKCWLGVMKPATGGVHRGCADALRERRDSAAAHDPRFRGGRGALPAGRRPAESRRARFVDLLGFSVRLTGEVIREADLPVLRVTRTVVVW